MEKLIELLNEYDKIKGDKEEPIYNWKIAIKTKIYQTYLVSARYGFIKRLVGKNKIDLGKIKKLYRKSNEHSTHTYPILYDYSYDESLLMYLNIQDEPIEYLVSILK